MDACLCMTIGLGIGMDVCEYGYWAGIRRYGCLCVIMDMGICMDVCVSMGMEICMDV